MLLAIDTSGPVCAACVFDQTSETVLATRSTEIGRGHAELLTGQINDCLKEADLSFKKLQRIAVINGPGSFTGLRVGLSAARGFALGLDIPVSPVTTLEALEYVARKTAPDGAIAVVSDARRNEFYWQLGDNNSAIGIAENIAKAIDGKATGICGTGSQAINKLLASPLPVIHELNVAPIEDIARLASSKDISHGHAEPLYLRAPDARLPSGTALERAL